MPCNRNKPTRPTPLLVALISLIGMFMGSFAQADQTVPQKAEDVKPIMVGQVVPPVKLKTIEGKTFDLNESIEEKPTLLIFYRGSWCPYCNTHLADLREIEKELLDMGFQILAISPDQPEYLKKTTSKLELNYQLLSDSDMSASKALGLAFEVDAATRELYVDYGIDLEKNSGQTHHLLPVPAAILVNPHGKVTFSFIAPDYKVRVENSVLLAAAKAQMEDTKKKLTGS
ncbi:peroxiredoxin-like family protein [Ketobacter sp.]